MEIVGNKVGGEVLSIKKNEILTFRVNCAIVLSTLLKTQI